MAKKKEQLYALIETIDYHNGETPAESEVHCIGTKKECEQALAIIVIKNVSMNMSVKRESDWYSTYTDEEGIVHIFTIKTPRN